MINPPTIDDWKRWKARRKHLRLPREYAIQRPHNQNRWVFTFELMKKSAEDGKETRIRWENLPTHAD